MLTRQLEESDSKILNLNEEVTILKALVERLNTENFQLKDRLSQAEGNSVKSSINGDNGSVLDEILVSAYNKLLVQQNLRNSLKVLLFLHS